MTKYILIEVCDREIMSTDYQSFEDAVFAMKNRIVEVLGYMPDEYEDPYMTGVDALSAYVTDAPITHANYDWKIVEVTL